MWATAITITARELKTQATRKAGPNNIGVAWQCPFVTILAVPIGPCWDNSTHGIPTVGSWPPKPTLPTWAMSVGTWAANYPRSESHL